MSNCNVFVYSCPEREIHEPFFKTSSSSFGSHACPRNSRLNFSALSGLSSAAAVPPFSRPAFPSSASVSSGWPWPSALPWSPWPMRWAASPAGISTRRFPSASPSPGASAGRSCSPTGSSQVIGGTAGAAVLYVIASGAPDFVAGKFASNGYGALSPGHYSLLAALVAEITLTAAFLLVILGSPPKPRPAGFAPLAIGLGAYPDPSHLDPGDEHLGQSGPLDRGSLFRADGRARPTLAVLGRAAGRCRPRRADLEIADRNKSRLTDQAAIALIRRSSSRAARPAPARPCAPPGRDVERPAPA